MAQTLLNLKELHNEAKMNVTKYHCVRAELHQLLEELPAGITVNLEVVVRNLCKRHQIEKVDYELIRDLQLQTVSDLMKGKKL